MWFTPWYPSPMADGGYDVADYRAIEPLFGDLAEAEALIQDAAAVGIRTIIDVVPNHVSDQHAWFRAALAAGPGARERERFWFRDGRGPDGELPPNGWSSEFGGPAWSRVIGPDGTPEQWYLHLFAPGQPDLNWGHVDVVREHEDILRFWFDRGVAGIRIDSAALVAKDERLPDVPGTPQHGEHPYVDREDLLGIYRSWRRIADSYGPDRVLIGEIWLPDAERFARYLQPGVLHTAFNFDFMASPWDAKALRASIEQTLDVHDRVGAPATWVLSNHDVTRPVTRYGREDSAFAFETKRFDTPTDLALGTRRARAAALLAMALPGAYYLFQGEELGLPEVDDPPGPHRGSDARPLGWRRPRPRRLSRAVPVVGRPSRRTASAHGRSTPGCPSPPAGAVAPRQRRPATPARCWRSTGTRCASATTGPSSAPATARAHSGGSTSGRTSSRSSGASASPPSPTCRTVPSSLPSPARVALASTPLEGGLLPVDATAWLDLG